MFLKKSLLFTTALALLMFAGQASAQGVPTLSLEHVPGDGGTAGVVLGEGTTFDVKLSQMGTPPLISVSVFFDFNQELLTLNAPAGFVVDDKVAVGVFGISDVPPPAEITFSFTTKADVTDQPFSIGIEKIVLIGSAVGSLTLPITGQTVSFNAGDTGTMPPTDGNGDTGTMPPTDGNGDTGTMPPTDGNGDTGTMPPTDGDMIASLTRDGATIVRGIGASAEVVVDVAVSGMEESFGAEIVFAVDPPVAKITAVNASEGILTSVTEGMKVTHAGLPAKRGAYGSVTFTTDPDYDGAMFAISIASFNAFEGDAEDGKMSVAAGAPLVVNKPLPTLTASQEGDVMIMPGGEASVMVTAAGFDGDVTLDGAAEDGTVTASAPGEVTVTATDGIDPETASVTINFEWGALTATSDADAAVMVMPGGSSSVTVTTSGQAKGATVTYALVEGAEGVTLDAEAGTVSATGAGMGSVTAWVGGVGSDPVSVVFEQGALTLSVDMTEVAIGPDGGSATLTASGQAEDAEVTFALAEGSAATLDGATVSASVATTATATASVGDVVSNAVKVAFVPSLHSETPTVTFDDFGTTAEASVTAIGFPEGAEIRFRITGGTGFATADGAATWTVSTDRAGVVTLEATDGTNTTAELAITFGNPAPYLTADPEIADVIIPDGGAVTVTVTVTGLGDDISWTVSEVTGTATVNISTEGATATLNAVDSDDLSQTSTVTLIASDGTLTTAQITITFRKMPEVTTEMADVEVPQAVAPNGTSMVVAVGFPPDAEITFNVEVTSGLESYLAEPVWDGNVLTLTATGSVTVSVTASGGGVTTSAVEVAFEQALPAAPASVVVQDQAGDNGYYVMVSFANSANHADVSQYRVYREMMVNTTLDADGNVVVSDEPVAKWMAWAVIDAMDNDDEEGMTRAVVPVTDATATRWGVAAEKGMDSAEDGITSAGKRVFSKESVQLMAQFLGLDPNLMVSQDELSEMFMPSADYINSIIGGRENVVFAALDPDLSVLVGDVSVPQNIRTDGYGPIVSSPITPADGMAGAVDDTAPAAVTDVAADAETGMVTWTMSADDMVVGMINYRGYAMPIPGVAGYIIRGGASEDSMIDIGVAPAGSTSFQVPLTLIETLINQGLPAVLVTVIAMDGTNMTPSVPLVVELIPTRKAFLDAGGGSVFVVKLDRHGAMTPLTVDFEDFVAFTMAFNSDETHENWRVFVQADLNDDKTVNFDDFILFFSSYGKEAQGPAGKSLVMPVLGVNEIAELSLRLGSDRVVVGETMFVDVSLTNVQALMGYGFVLHYDAEKFEFVEAVPAAEDLLKSAGGETPLFRSKSEVAGQVHVMNAIVNGSEVSGDGDVVRLVFRVLRDFEDNARFEIADGLVFDPNQFANPLVGGVLDIQTTPTEFALLQNFPNPFNPETTIGYELAESADVTLQIYNVVGQVVRTLMTAEPQSVGRYQVRWDGIDDRGTPVSSGIYFYQISAGKFQDVRKLMLLK